MPAISIKLASLPILCLIGCLGVLRLTAWKAALISLGAALAVALLAPGVTLSPGAIAQATVLGVRFALSPIALVIVAALFTYRVCKRSGAMLVIKGVLGNVSTDSRVIVLIVAWGFGNLIEGIAGFGTSVAIPAAVMAGIGMNPLKSVVACLIANASSTMFGSVGVGVMALASAADLEVYAIGRAGGCLAAPIFLITPFLMVVAVDGWRALKGIWPLCLAAGVSFVVPSVVVSQFLGPELADIVGAALSMATVLWLVRYLAVDDLYSFSSGSYLPRKFTAFHVFHASAPFVFVTIFLVFYAFMDKAAKAYLTPGVVIFAGAVLGGFLQGVNARAQLDALLTVLRKNWKTILTICAVLAMAKVMDRAGMMAVLAQSLADCTGRAYAFLTPVVGALGGFITGSGTSSNVLFGSLQANSAAVLGFRESIFAGANMLGAGIGKMVCPQSIAIGLSAVGLSGCESKILREVIYWFWGILIIACLVSGFSANGVKTTLDNGVSCEERPSVGEGLVEVKS